MILTALPSSRCWRKLRILRHSFSPHGLEAKLLSIKGLANVANIDVDQLQQMFGFREADFQQSR